ncbi:MAG TPA: DMT family transporter [Candidatus Limnocylindria bacterium]|nr:DMT family transporter [Candidatus Limnocylindria bacterium]
MGAALVASAAAMFGALSYITRSANELGMSAMPYVVWRAVIGTVAVLVLGQFASLRATRAGGAAPAWLPDSRRAALVIACLLGAIVNVAMFQAFLLTTIAVVLIVFYTYPALVTLASVVFYGERLTPIRAGALALSGVGLSLVVLSPILGGGTVTLNAIGVGLAVAAALCQASFFLIAGRGFEPLPAVRTATYAIMAAGVLAVVLAFIGGETVGLTLPFRLPGAWVWILAGGIIGAAIPTTALLVGIGIIGPSRAAILMTIEPLVAIVIAAIVFKEQPTLIQAAGGAAVLVAAVILQLVPSRVPPEPEFGPLV